MTTQWITGADFEQKLFAALLTKNAPDVFEFHPQIQLIKSGQVADLSDIINPVKDDFNQADITSHTVDGKIYGVRMIDDPQFFFYRPSLFAKAKVEVPTTLEELIEVSAKLKTSKIKGAYLGNDLTPIQHNLIWSAGADTLTADNKPAFNTDEVAAGLKQLRTLFTSGNLLLGAPTDWWDPSAFVQGLTAIQWCGMWAMPAMQQALGDDIGIFPFPKVGSAGKQSVTNGGWSMFVNAKGKNVEAAKEYVKWLWIDQKQYQEDWATSYGFHIPPRTSIARDRHQAQERPTGRGRQALQRVRALRQHRLDPGHDRLGQRRDRQLRAQGRRPEGPARRLREEGRHRAQEALRIDHRTD